MGVMVKGGTKKVETEFLFSTGYPGAFGIAQIFEKKEQ